MSFRIGKLLITGIQKKTAEIAFLSGLNVVAGGSNTGKSYILQCIDFILGAETPPKDIDEAKGYDIIFLELVSNDTVYTLERSLKGGEIRLHYCKYEGLNKDHSAKILRTKHSSKGESISSFLLSLFGIKDVKLKNNTKNELKNLTYRTISHFFLIRESSIIKESSPIFLESGYSETLSKSAFNYLITGVDDSSLIQIQDPEKLKSEKSAMLKVYDKLITDLQSKIEKIDANTTNIEINNIEQKIALTLNQIEKNRDKINEQEEEREKIWLQQKELESRLIVLDELLKRFNLLSRHYDSDLKRLEFISEGEHYFKQLIAVNCPLCGTSLENHDTMNFCDNIKITINDLQSACNAESHKIFTQQHDLQETITTLQKESIEIRDNIQKIKLKVHEIDEIISNEIKPRILEGRKDLEQLVSLKQRLAELEYNVRQLNELLDARNKIELDSPSKNSVASIPNGLDVTALRNLCDIIGDILKAWKFTTKGLVEFNQYSKKMDLVVDGRDRQSNGKGVRAIIYTAFTIGLMRYCKTNNLTHPQLVILDSPLTTYKEKSTGTANEDVSSEVQNAFYNNLSMTPKDEQIIIFENKEPQPDLHNLINYIEFTGESGRGRKGFFPV